MNDSEDIEVIEEEEDVVVVEPTGLPRDAFQGPEFMGAEVKSKLSNSRRKKIPNGNDVSDILCGRILCTACSKQINPFHLNSMHRHPVLDVLLCKTCYNFYHSGTFEQDSSGIDEHCRWCANGGNVCVICEFCPKVFCKACIRRNFTRTEEKKILSMENWKCFVCDNKPIRDKIIECHNLFAALKKYNNNKAISRSRKCKVKPGGSSPQEKDVSSKKSSNSETEYVVLRSTPSTNGGHKQQTPLQSWRIDTLRNINTMKCEIDDFKSQFAAHFQMKTEKGKSPLLSSNYAKFKTVKELKHQLGNLQSSLTDFLTLIETERTKLKSDAEQEYKNLSDCLSTTAKESDSDISVLTSPSKKKQLKKRKELDGVRLSSTENSPRKHLKFSQEKYKRVEDRADLPSPIQRSPINNEQKQSTELSDSGSSNNLKNKTTDVEMGASGASLSDIFEANETSVNENDKEKNAFTLPMDSVIVSDDLSKPDKTRQQNSLEKLDSVESIKQGHVSDEVSALNDISPQPPKKKSKKNIKESSSSNETCVESEDEVFSDDQQLPPVKSEMFKSNCESDSDSTNIDDDEEANKIAFMNIENQRLQEEESEVDEDVENLLHRGENEKSKAMATSENEKNKSEIEKSGDDKADSADDKANSADDKANSGDDKANSDDDKANSDDEVVKKSKYRNSLLNIRLSLSDCESEESKKKREIKRKYSSDDREPLSKKTKKELCCDEALNNGDLSDEDMLLLANKDEDSSPDDVVDEDILLSDADVKKNEQENKDVTVSNDLEDHNEGHNDDVKISKDEQQTAENEEVNKTEDGSAEVTKVKKEEDECILISLDTTDSEKDNNENDDGLPSFNNNKIKKQAGIRKYIKKQSSGDEFDNKPSKKRKLHRRRIIVDSDSDESVKINDSSSDDSSTAVKDVKGRRNIRKIIGEEGVSQDTKRAEKMEMDRRRRLEENNDEEVIVIDDVSSPVKRKITTRLILSKSPLVEVDPLIVNVLKRHQVDGVKFMWRNVIESVERANKDRGNGCILAHCMGLGKTLQVVAFLNTVLFCDHLPKLRSALVICPLGTVLNWGRELQMWLKNCTRQLKVYNLLRKKSPHDKAMDLMRWHNKGGVMVVGYNKYRTLCQGKSRTVQRQYQEMYLKALRDPGPDIVVCDEGHILKNEKTNLSSEIEQIKTSRRVVLTGTPLQNNLMEYHCMVSFIKPRLLGSKKEFANRFVNPILNGQHIDSTKQDVHVMKKRSHVLHELLAGFVQRKDINCLREHLLPKFEYVLCVRLSSLQVRLYERYLEVNKCSEVQGRKGQLFQDFNKFLLICSHPRALILSKTRQDTKGIQEDLRKFVVDEEEEEESDDTTDQEEQEKKVDVSKLPSMSVSELKKLVRDHGGDLSGCINKQDLIDRAQRVLEPEKNNGGAQDESWYDTVMPAQDQLIRSIEHSAKICLLLEILRLSAKVDDKVVVFSQSLLTLDLIEEILHDITKRREGGSREFGTYAKWFRGVDYFRIDGSTQSQKRKNYIDQFNSKDDKRARLFLISTKAGGIGINLVGANRAIVFDASWNPTHDVQSIFRIYRFGQEKTCYIYRFISQGTMEEKIYDRQVVKQSLAFRVVDEQQIERHFTASDIAELYNFKPDRLKEKSNENSKPKQGPPKDNVLADLLLQVSTRDLIVSFHEHDSLLDHQVEEELTEAERQTAWDEYDKERHPLVKDSSLLLKLPFHMLKTLINLAEKELENNQKLLDQCKEESLSQTMLKLKVFQRDLSTDEVTVAAMNVQRQKMMFKKQLEDTRRFIIQKLEQLRYCSTRNSMNANYAQYIANSQANPSITSYNYAPSVNTTRPSVPPTTSTSYSRPQQPPPRQYAPPNPASSRSGPNVFTDRTQNFPNSHVPPSYRQNGPNQNTYRATNPQRTFHRPNTPNFGQAQRPYTNPTRHHRGVPTFRPRY